MGRWDEFVSRIGRYASTPKLSLPEIPEGYVRLTHVMPGRSREILESGEPFMYRRYGLDGTTDAYSNNDSIEWLAMTGDPLGGVSGGKPSGWSRNDFGGHMALMDMPADAHKAIVLSRGAYADPLPNAALLGFVDRPAMAFMPNPRYDRAVIDDYGRQAVESIRRLIESRNSRFAHRPSVQELPIPYPAIRDAAPRDGDIW